MLKNFMITETECGIAISVWLGLQREQTDCEQKQEVMVNYAYLRWIPCSPMKYSQKVLTSIAVCTAASLYVEKT